jgi:hypothetical protein
MAFSAGTVPISQGSVAAMTERCAKRLDGDFLGRLRRALAREKLAHFDETGFRVDGKLHWVHPASSGRYSLVYVHANRGRKGIDAGGVLSGFTGAAVHDAWAPYDCYSDATHVLCCAHLLRELVAAIDADPNAAPGRSSSAPSAPTSPRPPNTESTSSTPSLASPRATPGCLKPNRRPDQLPEIFNPE